MQAAARLSSSSASRKVISGISGAAARSRYELTRGKARVASAPAQETAKGQKKVTKQERRAVIEKFIANYRDSNEGKFPSATSVRQQVGGSYYTVREVLQQLEYNSRLKATTYVPMEPNTQPSHYNGKADAVKLDLSTKFSEDKSGPMTSDQTDTSMPLGAATLERPNLVGEGLTKTRPEIFHWWT